MSKQHDSRELSPKPELDDMTDYQALNTLGRPKVLGQAEADDEENTLAQEADRQDTQPPTRSAESGEALTEEEFRALCREAIEDPRSMDPATLLYEVLVRVRSRAGEADPRGSAPVEYETTSGETYWKGIEEIVRTRLNGEFDVRGILSEVIEENTELKER